MKDITSTSFGLVIAFLLPGLGCLYGLSYYFDPLSQLFGTFLKAESNVGLFLLVTLAALGLGLEVSVLRWIVFQCVLCRNCKLMPEEFAALAQDGRLAAFRAAVDEHYRYHQFWGGVSVVIPLYGKRIYDHTGHLVEQIILLALGLLIEGVTILAARRAYLDYVRRAKAILGDVQYAQRLA